MDCGEEGAFWSYRTAVTSSHHEGQGQEELEQDIVLEKEDAMNPQEKKRKQAREMLSIHVGNLTSRFLDLKYDCFFRL